MAPTDPDLPSGSELNAPGTAPEFPPTVPTPPSLGARIFLGPSGLRSGWRVLFFFLAAIALISVAGAIAGFLALASHADRDTARLAANLAGVAGVFAATLLMIRIERTSDPTVTISMSRAGLAWNGAVRNAAAGTVCGFLALSLLMAALASAGFYSIQQPQWKWSVLAWAALWGLQFLSTGFLEEMMMRGYSLSALSQGIGFWPAAILLSVLFGAGHLANSGEQWLGIVNAVLVGIVFAYSVKFTGSLWWAIGAHAAWDWGETYFWGVSDSGFVSQQHLFSGKPAGIALLSGGSVGPEGSLFCIAAILLILALVRFTGYRAPAPAVAAAAVEPENLSILGEGSLGQLPENR